MRKLALPITALILLVLTIVTWDSIASFVFLFCLVMLPIIYLMNRFVYSDRESDFTDDDNN